MLSVSPGDGRGSALDVESYELDLDLTSGTDTFSSRTEVRFRVLGEPDGAAVSADLHAVSVRQAELNGTRLDAGGFHDGRLELPGLAASNALVVEAEFGYAARAEGLHLAYSPAGGRCVYSKANRGGAARMFCCFDRPDLRAPFTVAVRAPAGWSCVANAPAADHGADLWRFAPTAPLPPLLFGACAGPYRGVALACERDGGAAVPVTLCALPQAFELAEPGALLELLGPPLRFYERVLRVPYPYGKCDLAFVPGYPVLGFSTPGLITIQDTVLEAEPGRSSLYLPVVMAHELAHAWFGGLVTMRRDDDTWLIEAIATYLSRAALARIWPDSAPWAGSATLPDHGYADDAETIRQLDTLIGPRAVMLGLGSLLRRHAHQSATKDDLVRHWSRAGGRDLRPWAGEMLTPARPNRDLVKPAGGAGRR
jgi:aminopeptidase N